MRTSKYTVRTLGLKHGRCNICGNVGPLTEDHTPPKGCVRPKPVRLQALWEHMTVAGGTAGGLYSQNGVKYRTLCKTCNNRRLGEELDPHLIRFSNQVATALASPLTLPPTLEFALRPQAIVRAVLGHVMSIGVDRFGGPQHDAAQSYFLDLTLPLPPSISVLFWVYPFARTTITRDTAMMPTIMAEPFGFWLMKFYPLAFFVAWDQSLGDPRTGALRSFERWRSVPYDTEATVVMDLHNVPGIDFPEAPTKLSATIMGGEAIVATPR